MKCTLTVDIEPFIVTYVVPNACAKELDNDVFISVIASIFSPSKTLYYQIQVIEEDEFWQQKDELNEKHCMFSDRELAVRCIDKEITVIGDNSIYSDEIEEVYTEYGCTYCLKNKDKMFDQTVMVNAASCVSYDHGSTNVNYLSMKRVNDTTKKCRV